MIRVFNIIFLSAVLFNSGWSYNIPEPILQVNSPKGFTVSIPADSGIQTFGFQGAKNRKIFGVEPGDFGDDIRQRKDNRFVYENTAVTLNPGDILYYWIHVQHNGFGYRLLNKSIVISKDHFQTATPGISSSNIDSCALSKTLVKGVRPCKGELIFEDNFDILNLTIWRREVKIPLDTEDAAFVSFQERAENSYVNSGHLHIVPNLLSQVPGYDENNIKKGDIDLGSRCTGIVDLDLECRRHAEFYRILPPVISAKLRTKEFFSFLYGRIEVRAKLTKGDWLYPQIYLEPFGNEYGSHGYASGQMRIAFIRGNEILHTRDGISINGQQLLGGVVLYKENVIENSFLRSTVFQNHLGNEFHTYSLTWTDEFIELAIDGNSYATIRGGFSQLENTHNITHAKGWKNGSFMAPFDKEFFISLGVSAGGILGFPDNCVNGELNVPKPWNNTDPKAELYFWNSKNQWYPTWSGENSGMKIDYVRVWAL